MYGQKTLKGHFGTVSRYTRYLFFAPYLLSKFASISNPYLRIRIWNADEDQDQVVK
jgi:hypothetical protein